MILQRPKKKKAKQVKKTPGIANQSGTLAPSYVLPNSPPQVVPQKPNGHRGSARRGKPRLLVEPASSQRLPRAPLGSRAPRAPTLAPTFSPPPLPATYSVDEDGIEKIPNSIHREPGLYELISSKFDAVITSIDGESFSGDRRELGR